MERPAENEACVLCSGLLNHFNSITVRLGIHGGRFRCQASSFRSTELGLSTDQGTENLYAAVPMATEVVKLGSLGYTNSSRGFSMRCEWRRRLATMMEENELQQLSLHSHRTVCSSKQLFFFSPPAQFLLTRLRQCCDVIVKNTRPNEFR